MSIPLPLPFRCAYQLFLEQLAQLQSQVREYSDDRTFSTDPSTNPSLAVQVDTIQQAFQSDLDEAHQNSNETAIDSHWLAVEREISRSLRLLKTEAQLLTAARQSATIQTRQEQLSQRLEQLIHDTQLILNNSDLE